MKIFKLMAIALVAMFGFSSCNKDCGHDFIEVDYSNDIVGTWTCMEAGFAQAFVFKADGTAITAGVENGEYWEDVQVNWKVENNKLTLSHKDNVTETLLELIPGNLLSITGDKRRVYQYCANDLADEVVGMWVCNDAPMEENDDMLIQTFNADGTTLTTGMTLIGDILNHQSTYKVIGDLLFIIMPEGYELQCSCSRIQYNANGTTMGDVMTHYSFVVTEDFKVIKDTFTWLRINQSLDLAGKKYNHIKTFVSNVKGEDKDIDFMGYTFNFAKMDGSGLDKMLKALLFAVEFPNANKLTYSYQLNNNTEAYDANIVVEGNKMTIKMSDKVATLKDVVLYAFQDADCSQLHFYMHKTAFVNFYTNMQAMLMETTDEQFDINNAEAVNAIYNEINNAVETINVSLVMSK